MGTSRTIKKAARRRLEWGSVQLFNKSRARHRARQGLPSVLLMGRSRAAGQPRAYCHSVPDTGESARCLNGSSTASVYMRNSPDVIVLSIKDDAQKRELREAFRMMMIAGPAAAVSSLAPH